MTIPMALFGKKTKTVPPGAAKEKAEKPVASPKTETAHIGGSSNLAHVLISPRITEKASSHMALGVYAFDIDPDATKQSIAHAIYALYNVRPRAVRVVTIPKKVKRNSRTGKRGMTGGGKKAYIYLKKGETITLT